MRFTFLTALERIRILENLGAGDKIGDVLKVSNDNVLKSAYLTPEFEAMVGRLEYKHLENCGAFLYSVDDVPEGTNALDFLTSKVYCAQEFLMATWLIKDNCANFEMCFVIREHLGEYAVTSNLISHSYQSGSGDNSEITFSREELRQARKLHIERLGVKAKQLFVPDSRFQPDNSRIGRALTWMNAARGSGDYSIRVANFCSAFETLFSTSNVEISHQLSERIAIFLEPGLESRLQIYHQLKKAYELRSRIVHGSTTLQKPAKNAHDISIETESIARRLISKIIGSDRIFEAFNASNEALGEMLLSMTLQGQTPDTGF